MNAWDRFVFGWVFAWNQWTLPVRRWWVRRNTVEVSIEDLEAGDRIYWEHPGGFRVTDPLVADAPIPDDAPNIWIDMGDGLGVGYERNAPVRVLRG